MNPLDACAFNEVARTLSFTKAGKTLGLSRSAISKKIARLEDALGVVLLARTTRQVQLTEAGRTFCKYSNKVGREFELAAAAVRDSDSSPMGTLVLSIPSSLGAALTPALMSEFCERWPMLNLGIHFDDRPVDIIHQRYDLSICLADRLADSSLIAKRLGTTRKLLAASPGYLSTAGTPRTVEDLLQHRWLDLASADDHIATWPITTAAGTQELRQKLAVSSNSCLALVLSACLDRGILYVPEIYIANELETGRLRPVLDDIVMADDCGIYAVYPHRKVAAKVRVMSEFIEAQLEKNTIVDRWLPLSGHSPQGIGDE